MNLPPCGTQCLLRSAVVAVLVLLPVCGTTAADCLVKAERLPPPAARVGDWIDIVFTYSCVNQGAVSFVYDWGDGENTPADLSGEFRSRSHQYAFPGTYGWQVVVTTGGRNFFYSGTVAIYSGTVLPPDPVNRGSNQGGPDDNPYTEFADIADQGNCQLMGLPRARVNAATLNVVVEDLIGAMRGVGAPVDLRFTFNDNLGRLGSFGKGWSFQFALELVETCDGATVVKGSGQQVFFSGNLCANGVGDLELTPPPGLQDRLWRQGADWYWEESPSRQVWKFSQVGTRATKRAVELADPYGNRVSILYANGLLVGVRDAAGRTVQLEYAANSLLSRLVMPDGRAASFSYDNRRRLTQVVDFAGVVSQYRYFDTQMTRITVDGKSTNFSYALDADGFSRISAVTDAEGNQTRFARDAGSGTVWITDPRGATWVFEADTEGRTVAKSDPLGNRDQFVFTNGNLTRQVNPAGGVTTIEYDAKGNPTRITDPAGGVNRVTYNAVGDPVTRTDPLGNVWTFDWDHGHSLVGITSPLGNRISITYDARGQLVSVTGPNGDRTELAYDDFGNLLTTRDPLGAVIRFGYDASGLQLTSLTDPKGKVVTYTHDANDRLLRFVHPDGTYREFGYGCCAGTTIRDELGAIITQVRDPLLRRTRVVDALGNQSSFAYDGNGNEVSATDALGSVWSRQFDAANRLTRLTDPLGAAVEFLYDSLGRVVRFTDAGGRSTEFTYDQVGRLTSEKLPSGVVRTLKRDPAGRIQEITNGRGQKILFQHDAEGRLVSKSLGSVNLARFEYDPGGNLVQEVSGWGTTRYRYDGANRVIAVTYPDQKQASFAYDSLGYLSSIAYPGGLRVDYTYDSRHRLSRVSWTGGGRIDYAYDAAGNLLQETRSNGTESSYSFDANRRLVSLEHRKGQETIARVSLTRNAVGNSISEVREMPIAADPTPGSLPSTIDAAGRVGSLDGDAVSYDADGNLTNWRFFTVSYDAENRPLTVSNEGVEHRYSYDGLGRLVTAETGIRNQYFHYDPFGRLLFETDAAGEVTVAYIWARSRVAVRRVGASDSFFHFDSRGSTIALTGPTGDLQAAYLYDPYGKLLNRSGSVYNPFTFAGAYGVIDAGDGLYFMRYRAYHADLHRFLQRDPAGLAAGPGEYLYAGGNPVRFTDPLGLAEYPDDSLPPIFDIPEFSSPELQYITEEAERWKAKILKHGWNTKRFKLNGGGAWSEIACNPGGDQRRVFQVDSRIWNRGEIFRVTVRTVGAPGGKRRLFEFTPVLSGQDLQRIKDSSRGLGNYLRRLFLGEDFNVQTADVITGVKG